MEEKKYTEKEVFQLLCLAFERGFKKADIVEAGLEAKETDIECNYILQSFLKREAFKNNK